jgi:hypothetical protein
LVDGQTERPTSLDLTQRLERRFELDVQLKLSWTCNSNEFSTESTANFLPSSRIIELFHSKGQNNLNLYRTIVCVAANLKRHDWHN